MSEIDNNFVMKISMIIGEAAIKNGSDDIIRLANHFYAEAAAKNTAVSPIWRE